VYRQWYAQLPPALQSQVCIDQDTNITPLILSCDLAVSCETCTTALESWIAHKPTIELIFSRHPMFFHPPVAALNVLCNDPTAVTALIASQLASPAQKEFTERRQQHLAQWCNTPDGQSAWKIATIIAKALREKKEPDCSQLQWSDYRRASKLQVLRSLRLPYNYDPFLFLKTRFFPAKYATKGFKYQKTITPDDVAHARLLLQRSVSQDSVSHEA
jgi:hypothetical protein